MDLQTQTIYCLKATFLAAAKQEREKAVEFLKTQSLNSVSFMQMLCQMLSQSFESTGEDHKLVQTATTNFILKHVESLLSNTILLDQRRVELIKLFYETLASEHIIHRHKSTVAIALGKLLIGTWGENKTIGTEMFQQTIEVLKKGNYALAIYLFQAIWTSNHIFTFPVQIKEQILPLFLENLDVALKQCQQEVQTNHSSFERIQTLEYGLELILQYLNKITPDKYRPLLKEVLKEQRICGIIASVLAIAPQGNTRIILQKEVVFADNLNRLRQLSFSIIYYLINSIKTAKFSFSAYPKFLEFSRHLFTAIIQKIPHEISLETIQEKNSYLINRILQFLNVFAFIPDNHQSIMPLVQEIIFLISLPLSLIPETWHKKVFTEPVNYIQYIEEMMHAKSSKNTITSKAVTLTETICDKIDGALKHLTTVGIAILEHCLNPTNQSLQKLTLISPKLVNSPFFQNTTITAKFEVILIMFGSLAYIVSNRKDIMKDLEGFVIEHQSQFFEIKDKIVVLTFITFYAYYTEDLFRKIQDKDKMWRFFSYFCQLMTLEGQDNRALRIQASNAIQNMVQQNNFKSSFGDDIIKVTDVIVNSQTEDLIQVIDILIVILHTYSKQMAYSPQKIMEWLTILQNKVNQKLQSEKTTLIFARFLALIGEIIEEEQFYLFNDQVMKFFSPCLRLLETDNEYVDNVLDIIAQSVMSSHEAPEWSPQLLQQLIAVIYREKKLSDSSFGLLNILLIYMDSANSSEIKCIYEIVVSKLNADEDNMDLSQAILLLHLLLFYHHQLLSEFEKSEIINKTIRLMLNEEVNKDEHLFSKMVLLILIMLRQEFEFTSLLLEAHNDFLSTFYNLAYNNSSTYVEDYDYKVFVLIQSSIIEKYGHTPKQIFYMHQSFSLMIEFLQKLFKKDQPVNIPVIKNENEQYDYKDSDSQQERIETNQKARGLMEKYVSPLKQMDEWNNFKCFFNKIKGNQQRWELMSGILETLPEKQKNFLSRMALNIQKVSFEGETMLRHIIKIKRPS